MDRHNGREGNVRLINGTSEPEFAIAAGQIERWAHRERAERPLRPPVSRRRAVPDHRH